MSPMALDLAYSSDRRVAGWRDEAALVAAAAATSAASRALLHPRGGVQLLRDDGDVLVASRVQPIARRPLPTRKMTSASAWRLLDAALAQVAVARGCKFQDLLHTHAVWWDYEARRPEGLGGAAAALGGDDAARLPQYLTSSVQLILTDPPFGTRMETSQAQSDHDILTAADLKAAARLYQVLLRPGGHALIFCSFDQRDAWVSELRALQDMGASGKPSLAAFRVDSAPMLAIKDAHAFNSRRQSSTNLSNKAEVIIHATRCGADREDAYQAVNFRTFNVVPSRFLALDNVLDNVRPPHLNEVVRRVLNGTRPWLRPEQKAVDLLLELVLRCSQPGDLLVDIFAGTCSKMAACIRGIVGQHRRVVCCDADALEACKPRLRCEFVNQVLLGGYVSCGVVTADVMAAARFVADESVAAAADAAAVAAGLRRAKARNTKQKASVLPASESDARDQGRGSMCSSPASASAIVPSSASAAAATSSSSSCSSSSSSASSSSSQTSAYRPSCTSSSSSSFIASGAPSPAADEDRLLAQELWRMSSPDACVGDGPDWEAPAGLPCHSALPVHLLRWLAGRWAIDADEQRAGQLSATPGLPPPGRDAAVEVMKLAGVSVGDWPLRWQCALAVEDAEAGLSALAAHLGVCVARSRQLVVRQGAVCLRCDHSSRRRRSTLSGAPLRTWTSTKRRPRRRATLSRRWVLKARLRSSLPSAPYRWN